MRPLAREAAQQDRARRPLGVFAGILSLCTVLAIAPAAAAAPPAPRARPATKAPPAPRARPAAGHRDVRPAGRHRPLFAVCPVDPPVRYFAGDFGAPRYGGGFHRHQGVDIFAPSGAKIRAPFTGVTRISTSSAGGLGVYVYGRRGFVFNAHLSRLGKGGRVRPGTVIGFVGNSGNAQGSSPHDHFEWHPGGSPAVDPYPLLQEACTGRPDAKPHRPRQRHQHRRPRNPIRFLLAKLL